MSPRKSKGIPREEGFLIRLVPIPSDLELAPHESKSTLGPPAGTPSQDCDTVEVIHGLVRLPSGRAVRTVRARVFLSAQELEAIAADGGHFWLEFIGVTFPPVCIPVGRE